MPSVAATPAEPPPSEEPTAAPLPARSRRAEVAIGVVALLGLVWRVAYTLWQFAGDDDLFDEGDAFVYGPTALNTAKGQWFVNPFNGTHFADHPPLTVLALTPTGWAFPESLMAQRLTHCVFGTVAIVVIGQVARSLAGPVAGVAAAVLAAVNPNLWMNDAVIMSESISTVLIAVLLWAAVSLRRSPTLRRAAGTGALCGLTILARAEIGLFLPLLVVPAVLVARELAWRDRALRSGVAIVCAAAVVSPWTIWNTTKFAEPVLISTNDGTTLLGANCDTVYDTGLIGAWYLQCVIDFNAAEETVEQGLDASEVSVLQRRAGLEHIRENVGSLPRVVFARMGRTFGWWEIGQQVYANQGEGRPQWASWAGYWSFWALVPASVAGAVALRRRRGDLMPAAACLLTVMFVSAVFYGIARFRLPLDVMTCVLAGVAAAALVGRLRGDPDLVSPPARRSTGASSPMPSAAPSTPASTGPGADGP